MGIKLGKPAELTLLSVIFFSFMVAHEVVIEGMWESFTNIPDGIALYITLFQFTFVGLGALTVEALLPTMSDSTPTGTFSRAAVEDPSIRDGRVEILPLTSLRSKHRLKLDVNAQIIHEIMLVFSALTTLEVLPVHPTGGEKRQLGFWMNWLPFLGLSFLVFMSTALSNHAVHYVQYPVKVVFKSSKLLPTMLVSTCIGNSKAFGVADYAAALLLCVGTGMLV